MLGVIEEENELTLKHSIPILLKNLHINYSGKLSALTRKVKNLQNKLNKNQDTLLLDTFIIADSEKSSLGTECEKAGITENWLKNPTPSISVDINRRLILELRNYTKNRQIDYKQCAMWVYNLCHTDIPPHERTLRLQWERINEKQQKLKKEKHKCYLEGKYEPPKPKSISKPITAPTHPKPLKTKAKKLSCRAIRYKVITVKKEKFKRKSELHMAQCKNKKLSKKLNNCEEKLSSVSVRNINKRINRRDKKIQSLTSINQIANSNLIKMQKTIADIKQKYKRQSVLLNYHKKAKLQIKSLKHPSDQSKTCVESNCLNLREKIRYLENKNEELTEVLKERTDMQTDIKTFCNGRYSDEIREVYASLLSLNVGVKNVESVIRIVLTKLAQLDVGRLPKKTFGEVMLVEAKALAQIQASEAMLNNENLTLHTDGTKRVGKEYGGLQVGTSSGQYSLGISEMVRGDTLSFMTMIRNIFKEMSDLVSDNKCESEKKTAALLSKIKNLMTDRHVVNSSLKECLEKWKTECLPLVIENFDSLSPSIKQKFVEINHFKCNLHVLVNLGSQAETALKLWEKSVLISDLEDSHVNSMNTPDFIRASTKLCVPGADEKSGYGTLFSSFIENLDPPINLKMSTFHGHRINILFSMGASVFYHRHHIKEFIDTYFPERPNRLVSCISSYISNNVYLAGCRALGIIDKILTGPIWRHIESVDHILDLNDMWLTFLNYLEEFSTDPSGLLEGKPLYPKLTVEDDVYKELFNADDEELTTLTLESLQILCTNFLIIVHRQLGDNLPGGKFSIECVDNFEMLKQDSATVSTTNIVSERDFANFDRLKREKPNANTIALEGMILFTNNKTLRWLDSMEPEKKAIILSTARQQAPKMITEYRNRKEELKQKHKELLLKKKQDILETEKRKLDEIVKVTKEVETYGGLWNYSDILQKLEKLAPSEKMSALKCQIRYHKLILKTNPEDKSLLQFSANGIQFSLDKLVENLQLLINLSSEHTSDSILKNKPLPVFRIKDVAERKEFMKQQKDHVMRKITEIQSKYKNKKESSDACGSQPKKRKVVSSTEAQTNVTKNSILDSNPVAHSFKNGQLVGVAYSDCWYPGQVLKTLDAGRAEVKFLHPCNSKYETFQWPTKDDVSVIDNLFVFDAEFDLIPRDSSARTWIIPTVNDVKSKYLEYHNRYF